MKFEELPDEKQKQLLDEGVGFERMRKITEYLIGDLSRFNNRKRTEERDRVKHEMHI